MLQGAGNVAAHSALSCALCWRRQRRRRPPPRLTPLQSVPASLPQARCRSAKEAPWTSSLSWHSAAKLASWLLRHRRMRPAPRCTPEQNFVMSPAHALEAADTGWRSIVDTARPTSIAIRIFIGVISVSFVHPSWRVRPRLRVKSDAPITPSNPTITRMRLDDSAGAGAPHGGMSAQSGSRQSTRVHDRKVR